MNKNDKASEKKDKNFLDDILDSCQEFFAPIISAVESVFKSIYSAFDSLFSNGSNKGSSANSKTSIVDSGLPVVLGLERNARQSIANLLTLKPSDSEQEEEKRQKLDAFEKELKNSAKILVNDYVTNNQDEISGFVANDDEEIFRKIKEYLINIRNTEELVSNAEELVSNAEVIDLFDNYLKNEIIGCFNEFLQQAEEFSLKNEADMIYQEFICSKFANNEEGADLEKIIEFISLASNLQKSEIEEFIVNRGRDENFNSKDLVEGVLKKMKEENKDNSNPRSSFPRSSFFDLPVFVEVVEGAVPRSTIELSSNSPLSLQEQGRVFWT